jgi:uncharacterized integral membrane protein
MVDSNGMKRQAERNRMKWVAIALGIAAIVGLVILIAANTGGGTGGGIY